MACRDSFLEVAGTARLLETSSRRLQVRRSSKIEFREVTSLQYTDSSDSHYPSWSCCYSEGRYLVKEHCLLRPVPHAIPCFTAQSPRICPVMQGGGDQVHILEPNNHESFRLSSTFARRKPQQVSGHSGMLEGPGQNTFRACFAMSTQAFSGYLHVGLGRGVPKLDLARPSVCDYRPILLARTIRLRFGKMWLHGQNVGYGRWTSCR